MIDQRVAAGALMDWLLRRMNDLAATYPTITPRELVAAVHACAEHECPRLVARFNGDDPDGC